MCQCSGKRDVLARSVADETMAILLSRVVKVKDHVGMKNSNASTSTPYTSTMNV